MLQSIAHPDDIVELRLDRPPVNAINSDLVAALSEALDQAQRRPVSGIILSGRTGLFSAGLDIPELFELDREAVRAFWTSFVALLERIARSDVPVVAALTGHSPAGGTVLTLFADYRIQAEGDYQLGLNEVQVGLVVPPLIDRALVRLLGRYRAERHLVAGRMISVDQALAIGLVDESSAAEHVVTRALEWLKHHLSLPRHAMSATRARCRQDLHCLFDDAAALDSERFLDAWFEPQTQDALHELVRRLRGD